MKFDIKIFTSVGAIKFGMSKGEVRKILNSKFESFKRTPDSELPCDFFESLGAFVYYKNPGIVEAIEFTSPAAPTYDSQNLLSIPFVDLKSFLLSKDANLEIEADSLISMKLGISVYAPNAEEAPKLPVESIVAFEQGYYD